MKTAKVMQQVVDDTNTIHWEEIEVEVPDDFREGKDIVPFESYANGAG